METALTVRRDAMALLASREHSVKELYRKLKGKGYPQEIVEQVLRQLSDEGVQSDIRFAETYVYQRANRGFGPSKIQLELHERGIPDATVARFIDEDSEMWLDNLIHEHRKRFNGRMPEDYAERAKQMRFFQYRGFTSRQIHRFYAECVGGLVEQFV